ncbi:MAG: hypothetical protein KF809_04510 [Chloroflexi bacterium]|nr:hypothetical protein [Chloroflexota bacterium]
MSRDRRIRDLVVSVLVASLLALGAMLPTAPPAVAQTSHSIVGSWGWAMDGMSGHSQWFGFEILEVRDDGTLKARDPRSEEWPVRGSVKGDTLKIVASFPKGHYPGHSVYWRASGKLSMRDGHLVWRATGKLTMPYCTSCKTKRKFTAEHSAPYVDPGQQGAEVPDPRADARPDTWAMLALLLDEDDVMKARPATAPTKPWSEMSREERDRFRDWYIERWKHAHPDASEQRLATFVALLDHQDATFWERSVRFAEDFGKAYWEDLASGDQLEGLKTTVRGMASNFLKAGSELLKAASSELSQLPETLRHLPAAYFDDVASGEQAARLQGMLQFGGEVLGTAGAFWSDPTAIEEAIDVHGPQVVAEFLERSRELERVLAAKDPLEIRRKIGEIAGTAEFEVLIGVVGDKGLEKAAHYAQVMKNAAKVEEGLGDLRKMARDIDVPGPSAELLARRDELLAKVANGDRVKLTPDEASELFGIDRRITIERQGTILQHSEGAAEDGLRTAYKLSDDAESAITARQLREQYPDLYTGKANAVADKGFKPGEEQFMSTDDLAKLRENPLKPGETINYKPRQLSAAELDTLSPELQERYAARMKDAGSWDKYDGPANPKHIDLSDPKMRERYGDMWVTEDTRGPAKAAEFWRDPSDNRIYVRYQTADGSWHGPKLQASDIDTVTHSGGTKLTYEQQRDMQYNQSFGQLGEGDTPKWAMEMIEQGPDGYVLRGDRDPKMLLKAIDTLKKTEATPVLTQGLDGLFLEQTTFKEMEYLAEAAQAIQSQGGWDAGTQALLKGWGVLP